MIKIRKSAERGMTKIDWLTSYHTFSFGNYYDENHTQFGKLRVINDDIVAPDSGFPTHGHRDMEIITYVLSGAVAHKDSSGGEGIITPGEVQRMTAGKGILHSEYNPSASEELHLLQIWILPSEKGLKPEYEQRRVAEHKHGLKLIVSSDGRENSLKIHQDADIYSMRFDKQDEIKFPFSAGDNIFLQVAKGVGNIEGNKILAGDTAEINGGDFLKISGKKGTDILIFRV